MRLRFTKMHGCGNDFVVVDAVNQQFAPTPRQARAIADRHYGIGCDQLLLVERSDRADADFRYRIFNANGGQVEQCGNGQRCLARFVIDKGLWAGSRLAVETPAGMTYVGVESLHRITVDMGEPGFTPASVPFSAATPALTYPLEVTGEHYDVAVVSMGNPHAILRVPDVDTAPVESLGPSIERHPRFPRGVNVGFLQIVSRDRVRLRVFERGVGETLACGTGACAAMVSARRQDLVDAEVAVVLRGGELFVRWAGPGQGVSLSGPAETVFEGEIEI